MDISIPVSTHDTLQQALEELYIRTELLEAANQYRCNSCNQLVDATRVCTEIVRRLCVGYVGGMLTPYIKSAEPGTGEILGHMLC